MTIQEATYDIEHDRKAKCLSPVTAYICGSRICKDGITSPNIVFSHNAALEYYIKICGSRLVATKLMEQNAISMPCGHCQACELRKRKDMSTRLANEASLYSRSCFLTLTYDDDHLPHVDGVPTLYPTDLQLFMKRLRRRIQVLTGTKYSKDDKHGKRITDYKDYVNIRFFAVGEYGSKTHRPHYHVMIFGWTPADGKVKFYRNGHPVNISDEVQSVWKNGIISYTSVTPEVAKYCARYVTKKYIKTDTDSSVDVVPEFTLQSVKGGGIGSPWLERFKENLFTGFVNIRCKNRISKHSIPQYYYNRLRKLDLPCWLRLRNQRLEFVKRNPHPFGIGSYAALVRYLKVQELNDARLREFEVF